MKVLSSIGNSNHLFTKKFVGSLFRFFIVLVSTLGFGVTHWDISHAQQSSSRSDLDKTPSQIKIKILDPENNQSLRHSRFIELVEKIGGIPRIEEETPDQKTSPQNKAIEELVDRIEKQIGGNFSNSNTFSVPDGRSLQRSNTDFQKPRTVIVTAPPPSGSLQNLRSHRVPEVYLGYAERDQQVEVLSFNKKTGRYDFFIVDNFSPGNEPEITLPNRSSCVMCHQAEGPILSRFPWAETTFNRQIVGRILNANASETSSSSGLGRGFSIRANLITADAQIRDSNRLTQARQFCQTICDSGDIHCQKQLLSFAILALHSQTGGFSRDIKNLAEINKRFYDYFYKKNWNENDFGYPSSVLPDRNPLIQPERGGATSLFRVVDIKSVRQDLLGSSDTLATLRGELKDQFEDARTVEFDVNSSENQNFDSRIKSNQFTPEAQQRSNVTYNELLSTRDLLAIPGLNDIRIYGVRKGSLADPARTRPLVNRLYPGTAFSQLREFLPSCFSFTNQLETALDSITLNRLKTVILEDQAMNSFQPDSWPPSGEEINRHFQEKLDESYAKDSKNLFVCESETSRENENPLELDQKNSILGIQQLLDNQEDSNSGENERLTADQARQLLKPLLTQNCASCHTGENPIIEVPVDNLGKLLEYRDASGDDVVYYLREGIMPPPDEQKLSAQDRARMIQAFRAIKDPK